MEIVSLRFQDTDDSKEFPVIDVVVLLCWDEGLEEIGTRVSVTIRVSLEEDDTRGVLGGIGGDSNGFREVRKV